MLQADLACLAVVSDDKHIINGPDAELSCLRHYPGLWAYPSFFFYLEVPEVFLSESLNPPPSRKES
jgi:hypothetical protein